MSLADATFALRKSLRVADGTIVGMPGGLGRRAVQQAVRDTSTDPRLRLLGGHPRGAALLKFLLPEIPSAAKETSMGKLGQNVQPGSDPQLGADPQRRTLHFGSQRARPRRWSTRHRSSRHSFKWGVSATVPMAFCMAERGRLRA